MQQENGIFYSDFTLPDVYGVFTFKMTYQRHGYSWLETKDTVQIRPFRHNEYPRFMVIAYPYYGIFLINIIANIFSMMGAFMVLCSLWLFNKNKPNSVGNVPEKEKKNK